MPTLRESSHSLRFILFVSVKTSACTLTLLWYNRSTVCFVWTCNTNTGPFFILFHSQPLEFLRFRLIPSPTLVLERLHHLKLEFHHLHKLHCLRSEEHTSELQSRFDLVCRLLLE